MPKSTTKMQWVLRSLAALIGVALLTYLIRRVGSEKIVENIVTLGWGLALVIALGGVAHLVKTCAWRLTLTGCRGNVSFLRLLQLRLASEAVGMVGALGQIFGEGLRVSALGPKIPIDSRISSVTLDRAMFIASTATVSLVGIVAALLVVPLSHALRLYAVLFAVALLALLVSVALAMLNRWPFVSSSARVLGRLRFLRVENALPLIHSIERKLFDFHRDNPRRFWASLALNFACQCMAILEVYLVLWLLGVKVGALEALVFEALTKLLNAVGTLVPGNIGTYEGGNVLIAHLFGLSGALGLSIAMTRRIRAIFWAAVGSFCLVMLSRFRAHSRSESSVSREIVESTASGRDGHAVTAVILVNTFHGVGDTGSPLLRIGTLPILLRNILSVRKAVGSRIIVCVDPVVRRDVQRDLLATGRLPHSVEWLDAPADMPLAQLFREIASITGKDHLLLVAGNCTYYPALFRQAREWSGESGALALTTNGQPVGIYALSADIAMDVAERCPSETFTLAQLDAWLTLTHPVEYKPIEEGLWQRVLTPEDCIAAERKLDRWLVKPTDGFFAQMNRRVSVPISRQLIKLPITPNMVSLFTLGVGFAAGVFYACGGYWNMLIGAILSLLASILDGSDGEVARLKLMESDFGCWLETVCDWLYYLFIFAGMAIGLSRSSETNTYLVWGGVLLFGAVMSFLVTGFGRHLLAAGRPEQYLGIWWAKAESRRSNPILYMARRIEFVIRRCFLPYALLAFALLNITKVAFFLTAIGANGVWLISLYSYCAFAVSRRPPVTDSAVSL